VENLKEEGVYTEDKEVNGRIKLKGMLNVQVQSLDGIYLAKDASTWRASVSAFMKVQCPKISGKFLYS
jgi:hypothetical protein